MKNHSIKQIAFAVGTGRCGTNFLHKVLKDEPGIASTHERHALNDTFHRFCKWYELPVDDSGFLTTKKNGIAEDLQLHDISFESSAFLSFSIRELSEAFGAKFILLVRSPEKVINSYITKGWYKDEVLLDDPDKIPSSQPNLKDFHHFLGRTLPRGQEFIKWKKLSRVGKLAWYWKTLNSAVLEQFQLLPESQKRIIKIEELDFRKYIELCSFIGFKPIISQDEYKAVVESRPNAIGRIKTLADWNKTEINEFQQHIADLAGQLNYDIDIKTKLEKEDYIHTKKNNNLLSRLKNKFRF